ncbi:MAG TPA: Hsp20/alpha crystallin family protein [Chloroflexota bacterium]|nr:Hsp20/alpha crystallin family protein [Chloroflexota bacterium]
MAMETRAGLPLRELINRLFDEAFVWPWMRGPGAAALDGVQVPPVNMYATGTDLVVIVPLPGVSPRDIQVELLGTRLTVRAEVRRDEPGGAPEAATVAPGRERRWYLHEFQIGPYYRAIDLPYPVDADRIQTSYEHGLLALRCPFAPSRAPRRIPLQVSEGAS